MASDGLKAPRWAIHTRPPPTTAKVARHGVVAHSSGRIRGSRNAVKCRQASLNDEPSAPIPFRTSGCFLFPTFGGQSASGVSRWPRIDRGRDAVDREGDEPGGDDVRHPARRSHRTRTRQAGTDLHGTRRIAIRRAPYVGDRLFSAGFDWSKTNRLGPEGGKGAGPLRGNCR